MNWVDVIFLVALGLCVVIGIFKGIIKQVLTILGIFVVATLTATVAPLVQGWFAGVIDNENTRSLIAMVIAALILSTVYGLAAWLVNKLLKRVKIIKVLNRVLGGVMGLLVVYLLFAVIFALFKDTGENFMPLLKKAMGNGFNESWVGNHLYRLNFFGRWIVVGIAQRLLDSVTPAALTSAQSTFCLHLSRNFA